jgi:hypothetical protein
MLLLAGQPLAVPKPELLSYIEANISIDRLRAFAARSWPGFGTVGLAYPTAYRPWPPQPYRLNRFYWPVGATRWGWGIFLADTDTANNIEDSAFGNGSITTPVTFQMSAENQVGTTLETVSTQVYVMPPIPLFRILNQSGASTRGMFAVAVADQRVYWRNVATPDFGISESSGTTWTTILNSIAGALGISLTIDTINANYLLPSRAINLTNEPADIVLDSILYNIGQRLVVTFSGQYKTQNFSTALTAYNADLSANPNRTLRAGGNLYIDPL